MADNCYINLKNALPDLSEDEVKDIRRLVNRRIRRIQAENPNAKLEDITTRAVDEIADEVKINALIQERNALLNIKRKQELIARAENFKSPAEALLGILRGINKVRKGGRLSVDAMGKGIFEQHFGAFMLELEQGNVHHEFRLRSYERDVAKELWEIRDGGNPGVTNNPKALKIAEIMRKYEDSFVDRQNRAGAYIRKMPGYIVRQTHDMFKTRKVSFSDWKSFIIDKLDHNRTFVDVDADEIDDFLRGIFDGFRAGVHLKALAGDQTDLYPGGRVGALAKRTSANRKLHFKDSDSWMDYNDKFGSASLKEAFIFGMGKEARNIALMETFGPNPRVLFDDIKSALKRKHRDNPEFIDELNKGNIEHAYAEVDGTTRIPASIDAARIGGIIRAIQNMSKLGGATLSAMTDIPLMASELRYHGHNLFDGYFLSLKNIVGSFARSEDKKAVSRLIGVGMDGMRGDILARFGAVDSLPGSLSRAQQLFFRLNLLTWWTDAHKSGFGLMVSNHFASMKEIDYNGLSKEIKRLFTQYDISEIEWNTIRSKNWHMADDNEYYTPELIDQLTAEDIRILKNQKEISTESAQIEFKDNLKTRFAALISDRADFAVPTPSAREFSLLKLGTQPGTVLGEATRFMMQFKAFPITVLTKPLSRELFGEGADNLKDALFKGKANILGLVHMIVAMTIFGYVAQSAKNLVKGREPRDPKLPATWLAAAAQGGGMGIYGDFLFGEFNRFGRSFLATMAGPTFGSADDIAEIYTRVRNGEDAASQAFRFALNNTPYINLFYTRAAFDYLILYQIQEMLNPGYLRRLEKRIHKQNNQKFLVPPSEHVRR